MYRAHEVMNTNVVTIRPEATVEEAIRMLVDHHVSGTPVVDRQGTMVGIISEFQLLEAIYTPDVKKLCVAEVMSKDVVSVEENTLLSDVASLFVLNRIRRVPVVRGQRLIGVISRRDLLRYILDMGDKLSEFLADVRCEAVA